MAEENLRLEQATLGYSTAGLDEFITQIHTSVIDTACTEIKNAGTQLKNDINSVWRGKSAEIFKTNMDHDFQTIREALEEVENLLKVELHRIAQEMADMDQNLMKENR